MTIKTERALLLLEKRVKELAKHLTNVSEFFYVMEETDFSPDTDRSFYRMFDKMAMKNKELVNKLNDFLDDKIDNIDNADHRKQRGRTAPNRKRRKRK